MKLSTKVIIFTSITVCTLLFLVPILTPVAQAVLNFREFIGSSATSVAGGNLTQLVQTIINILFVIAGVVAVIYLIIGGYQYVTSAGDSEAATKGRTTVLNAIIGLIIIFASYLIINFVMTQVLKR